MPTTKGGRRTFLEGKDFRSRIKGKGRISWSKKDILPGREGRTSLGRRRKDILVRRTTSSIGRRHWRSGIKKEVERPEFLSSSKAGNGRLRTPEDRRQSHVSGRKKSDFFAQRHRQGGQPVLQREVDLGGPSPEKEAPVWT